jgi:hypothetical protein
MENMKATERSGLRFCREEKASKHSPSGDDHGGCVNQLFVRGVDGKGDWKETWEMEWRLGVGKKIIDPMGWWNFCGLGTVMGSVGIKCAPFVG